MKTNEKKHAGIKLQIAAIFIMALLYSNLNAQGPKGSNDIPQSPYFLLKNKDLPVESFPLNETNVDVNISGVIADVTVEQKYVNSGLVPIEAVYVFPGSTRSAVYSMKMKIGSRIIEAEIHEKQKARKIYEKAKEKGKRASLLEQHRPNVFTMNVANVMPGDTIAIELCYTEVLIPNESVYEFVFPTVVGPRYENKRDNDMLASNNTWTSNPYLAKGENPQSHLDINVNLNSGIPVKELKSDSHDVSIKYVSKNKAEIKLRNKNDFSGNRDYILQYKLAGDKIETGLLMYEGKDENFFLSIIQPPERTKKENIAPREYIFIVDVSGSMNGFPLEVSKAMFKSLMTKLSTRDKFNILFFAGGSDFYSDKSLSANETNIKAAIEFLNSRSSSGGTEMLPAIQKAMKVEKSEGFSRSFVILTDGYVSIEPEAFKMISDNLGKANFFPFGIGTSVNRHIIEGIAHVGNSEPFVITNRGEANEASQRFIDYISAPLLTDIKLNYEDFEVYDYEPTKVRDIFANSPVIIFGKWKGKPKGKIVLQANANGKHFEHSINLKRFMPDEKNNGLKYLWAREKIRNLSDFAHTNDNEDIKTEVTNLGLKYNLLTNYTSFVAVEKEIINANGEPETIDQPLPLPLGVEESAVSVAMEDGDVPITRMEGIPPLPPAPKVNEILEIVDDEMELEDIEVIEEECEETIFLIVEQMPEFPGGEKAMQKYIVENLKYPETAREYGISGKVYLRFVINEDGSMSNITVARGVDPLLDAEAIRVLKKMAKEKKWKWGLNRGKPVKVWYTIPISFNLN